MPRKPRVYLTSNYIHIMVQGIDKEYIFQEDNYKKKYLYLLFSSLKESSIIIIAFCVMDNHVHLLVHFDKYGDVTKLMHVTNSAYGKWYNKRKERVGYVFRDRYKVEEIQDLRHLYACINYIHKNPIKAGIVEEAQNYKFSSYREYANNCGICNEELMKLLHFTRTDIKEIILNPLNSNKDEFYMNNPQNIVEAFFNDKKVKSFKDLKSIVLKKELVLILKVKCEITYIEIAKLLDTSRSNIYRIPKSK